MAMDPGGKTEILVTVPLRASFLGGGTDFPAYYQKHGTSILSCGIDKKLTMRLTSKLTLKSLRDSFKRLGIIYANDIGFQCDEWGKGLGASSAKEVASEALGWLLTEKTCFNPMQIAQKAFHSEHKKAVVGIQDHLACAHGNLRYFMLEPNGISQVCLTEKDTIWVEDHCLLWPLKGTHNSQNILTRQSKLIDEKEDLLNRLSQYALHGLRTIGDAVAFGRLILEGWSIKQKLAPGITNAKIDELFAVGLGQEGCTGGKLLGAGGAGYFIFVFRGQMYREHALKMLSKSTRLKISRTGIRIDVNGVPYDELARV